MAKYINTVTGQVISVSATLSGGHWELIPEVKKPEKKKKGRPRKTKTPTEEV